VHETSSDTFGNINLHDDTERTSIWQSEEFMSSTQYFHYLSVCKSVGDAAIILDDMVGSEK
jgi:hypothetical protein